MSLPTFAHLLRDVLRRLGSAPSDAQSVCSYSLRRCLPFLAPDALAFHLGNWVESISFKRVSEKWKAGGVVSERKGEAWGPIESLLVRLLEGCVGLRELSCLFLCRR